MLAPPPRPYPRHLWRLPERKHMTIALGILAADGIVIAADTQESFGIGGAKYSSYKIFSQIVRDEQRAISATGAGWASYLDAIHQELAAAFVAERMPAQAEARMRLKVREFYDAHIVPMHGLPREERPSINAVIGTTWKSRPPRLFATDGGTLRRVNEYVAVGAGGEHASVLLSRLLPRPPTVHMATFLAVYVLFVVKEYVEGCGKDTHVTILQDGNAGYLDAERVTLLEADFANYLKFDALAVNFIAGRPVSDVDGALGDLMRYLASVRSHTERLPRQIIHTSSWNLDWADKGPTTPTLDGLMPVQNFADPPPKHSPSPRRKSRGVR